MRPVVFAATLASVVLCAGGVFAETAPATADGAPAAAAAKPRKDPNDPDRMICKTERPTGSRLGGEKTCMTKAQWDDFARETQAELDRTTISHGGTATPGK